MDQKLLCIQRADDVTRAWRVSGQPADAAVMVAVLKCDIISKLHDLAAVCCARNCKISIIRGFDNPNLRLG